MSTFAIASTYYGMPRAQHMVVVPARVHRTAEHTAEHIAEHATELVAQSL